VAFQSYESWHVRGDTNRRADAFVFGPLSRPWAFPDGRVSAAVAARANAPVEPYDFDADGRQDLTVGLPRHQPHGAPDAGAVVVLPGTRRGPSSARRVISRDTPGVPGVPFGDDGFGLSLASTDFDGDGDADLAAAVPGDRAVYVLNGSAHGLSGTGMRRIHLGDRKPVLAAGDLDGDSFGDLVVGPAPLRLYHGSPAGLSQRSARTITAPKGARTGFGAVVALGDVDGDGHVDLVEAAPGWATVEDEPGTAGHLTYCAGSPSGPMACRRVLGDRPGPASLAVADVTGDGRADIVAGVPVMRFHYPHASAPGGVMIFPGAPGGPGQPITVTPATPGVPGHRGGDDAFGASVAAAELDGDRFADIVVGAPHSIRTAGRLWIIRGGPSGDARSGHLVVDEASTGVPGTRAPGRLFGASVTVLDTDGDGRRELVVGIPGSQNGDRGAGAVTVLRIASGRLRWRDARMHSLRSLRLSAPEAPPNAFLGTPGFGAVLGRPAASSSTGEVNR
jgi:hypothetical protein